MTALGPYKGTQTINFDELEDRRLFVISGATGAGKTTIFDAITYALYGTASGSDRENVSMLRSHFADDDVNTSVELTFKLHDNTYRIFRQMGHRKEGNKTKTGESYEFVLQAGSGKDDISVVERQIVTEINEKVESLIGLTVEQFKQIVMLPQGEFRELLTSNTQNKEEILRRIFQTERYQHMNELLRNKHQTVSQELAVKEEQLERLVTSLESSLVRREESELFALLDEEHFQITHLLEHLKTEIDYYEQKIIEDKQLYKRSIEKYEQQHKQTTYAEVINKKFDQQNEKQTELTKLLKREDEFKEKEQKLKAAERASSIEPYELQLREREQESNIAKVTLKNNEQQLLSAQQNAEQAKTAFAKEEARKGEREQLTEQLLVYEKYVPTVETMNETKAQINAAEKELQTMHNELTRITQNIEQNEEKINIKSELIKQLDKSTVDLPSKQRERERLLDRYSLWDNLIKQMEQYKILQEAYKEAKQLFDKEAEQLTIVEKQWVEQQAAVLAQSLADDEACPVCGSRHHPNKQHSEVQLVSDEQFETLKLSVQQLQNNYYEAQSKVKSGLEIIEQMKSQLQVDVITLRQAKEQREEITEEGLQLKKIITNLEEEAKKLVQTRENVEQYTEITVKLREQKERLEKTYSEKQIEQATKIATFKESIREIPEQYQQIELLQKNIAETKELKTTLEKNWQRASEQLKQAETALTTGQVQLESSQVQLKKAAENTAKAKELFKSKIEQAQFSTVELYTEAKLSVELQEQLQTEIEQYKQYIATLEKQLADLATELADEKRADVEEMNKHLQQMKERYERALEQMNLSRQQKEKAQELHEQIGSLHELVASLEKDVVNVQDVYDVLRGQNSKRISFERYLQIDYLDQIIYAANSRFKTLTDGQYHLVRSERQESYGRQSGLTIDVYDAYTGQMRDVKTLSGGEKFIASLCLALGMSDVIQSYQGSIRIDTMFIDEGFGSLDDESLHKSIDALVQLQETGRTIGVISHVNELKQMFPARLEVTKTKEGHSSARFILR